MKYLHLFENKGDIYWIIVYECLDDSSANSVSLFDDEESARNYYTEVANDLKSDYIYRRNDREITEDEMIVTYEEAEKWFNDNNYDYNLNCKKIVNEGKYELPKELTIVKNSRKYNL